MARQRLTRETLDTVNRIASAREYARLAESILGPAATDREVLETAKRLSSLSPTQVQNINRRRQAIHEQTRRLNAATVDGAEDPWDEAGPEQPDPTNNQAYTKQIMTTPDHGMLESLQKRDVHAPTAARLSRQSRQKWGADMDDELGDLEKSLDLEDEEEVGEDLEDEEEGEEGLEDEEEDEGEDEEDEDEAMHDIESEYDDETLLPEEGAEGLEDLEGEQGLDLDEDEDDLDQLMNMEGEGEEDLEDEGDLESFGGSGEVRPGMPPAASRKQSSRRQASGKGKEKKKQFSDSTGAKVTIDDILNLQDEDIEREASSPLEGDDLAALLGQKVERAGNRVDSPNRSASSALENHRAAFERVWNTEDELEGQPRRRTARAKVKTKSKSKRVVRSSEEFTPEEQQFTRTDFAPDRRRVAARRNANEFDQVFGAPDVSRFFE